MYSVWHVPLNVGHCTLNGLRTMEIIFTEHECSSAAAWRGRLEWNKEWRESTYDTGDSIIGEQLGGRADYKLHQWPEL